MRDLIKPIHKGAKKNEDTMSCGLKLAKSRRKGLFTRNHGGTLSPD